MPKLTKEQRVFLVNTYLKHGKPSKAIEEFEEQFEDSPSPSRNAIYKILKKFNQTGSIADLKKTGRPRSIRKEETFEMVAKCLKQSPQVSHRQLAKDLGISRGSFRRIIQELKLKPKGPAENDCNNNNNNVTKTTSQKDQAQSACIMAQSTNNNTNRRIEYCSVFLSGIQSNPQLINEIIWTDEAAFKIGQSRINVWGGISTKGVVGPLFFNDNQSAITVKSYLSMLDDVVWPTLVYLHNIYLDKCVFQHDSAPYHVSKEVVDWLNVHFPGRWVGPKGFLDYPASSPDLTPMGFFLWGYVRERVNARGPVNVPELKRVIQEEFGSIPYELCQRACDEMLRRHYEMCIQREGRHFERVNQL